VYGLSDEDLAIQSRARSFADELIPFEVTAEMDGGELPPDVTAGHAKRARELGLHSTNMPTELGGGCSMLQVVLVQEQMGRVTNALGWVAATPPSWLPPIATPYQIEQFVRPAVAGEREECYAITEEGAGSDVAGLAATARRVKGDGEYVLNGVKWHVTSYNTADFAFFQGVLADGPHAGEHADRSPLPGPVDYARLVMRE
jgi:acyl-CoA dehydrogenase